MAQRSGGSSRAGGWVLALVGTVTVALVAGVVYYWMIGNGMAPVPAALAPPPTAGAPRAAAPVPVRDPRAAAAELVAMAPEITPAAAILLVHEVPNASGPGLADFGLVVATRGFGQMAQAELDEMSALIDQSYATLPPADHTWMGDYMRMLRDGTISAADGLRGRRLLTQAVTGLAPERRQRLQALMETAIRAGIEARHTAEARGRQELLAPPSSAAGRAPTTVAIADSPSERPRPAAATPYPPTDASSSLSGKGEAYWRARMQSVRARVVTLKAEVDALDKEAARWMYGPGEGPTCLTPQENSPAAEARLQDCLKTKQNWQLNWQAKQKDRLDRLSRKREELAAAERAIDEAEDEARRDGALPGWLRE